MPSISLFMFERCLYIQREPIIKQKIENTSILKNINAPAIAAVAARIEERETYLVVITTIKR